MMMKLMVENHQILVVVLKILGLRDWRISFEKSTVISCHDHLPNETMDVPLFSLILVRFLQTNLKMPFLKSENKKQLLFTLTKSGLETSRAW